MVLIMGSGSMQDLPSDQQRNPLQTWAHQDKAISEAKEIFSCSILPTPA